MENLLPDPRMPDRSVDSEMMERIHRDLIDGYDEELEMEIDDEREELRRHGRELERLACTDPLTGAANRRAFMDRADAELARQTGRLRVGVGPVAATGPGAASPASASTPPIPGRSRATTAGCSTTRSSRAAAAFRPDASSSPGLRSSAPTQAR